MSNLFARSAMRWFGVKNVDTEPAPPYGLLAPVGLDSATGLIQVQRPLFDGQQGLLINGPGLLPPNAAGQAHQTYPAVIAFDDSGLASVAPAASGFWGPIAPDGVRNAWKLQPGYPGFLTIGTTAQGRVLANPCATPEAWIVVTSATPQTITLASGNTTTGYQAQIDSFNGFAGGFTTGTVVWLVGNNSETPAAGNKYLGRLQGIDNQGVLIWGIGLPINAPAVTSVLSWNPSPGSLSNVSLPATSTPITEYIVTLTGNTTVTGILPPSSSGPLIVTFRLNTSLYALTINGGGSKPVNVPGLFQNGPGGSGCVLSSGDSISLWYDSTDQRWDYISCSVIPLATATQAGLVGTGTQTFAGNKTLEGLLQVGDSTQFGVVTVYDSGTGSIQIASNSSSIEWGNAALTTTYALIETDIAFGELDIISYVSNSPAVEIQLIGSGPNKGICFSNGSGGTIPLFVGSNQGQSTTIGYNKSGGGTGTMTFTDGLLTAFT